MEQIILISNADFAIIKQHMSVEEPHAIVIHVMVVKIEETRSMNVLVRIHVH
jgi:hypothetical protein